MIVVAGTEEAGDRAGQALGLIAPRDAFTRAESVFHLRHIMLKRRRSSECRCEIQRAAPSWDESSIGSKDPRSVGLRRQIRPSRVRLPPPAPFGAVAQWVAHPAPPLPIVPPQCLCGCASKFKNWRASELSLHFCTILFREGNTAQSAILPIMKDIGFLSLLCGIARCFALSRLIYNVCEQRGTTVAMVRS
jgi:hypothetical protein